jgi:hypothetical protein
MFLRPHQGRGSQGHDRKILTISELTFKVKLKNRTSGHLDLRNYSPVMRVGS